MSLSLFTSSIWQHIQNKELTTKYREDECFRLKVKKLIALAFVPVDEVKTAFDLIADEFDDDTDDLLDYFEKRGLVNQEEEVSFLFLKINLFDNLRN